MFRYKQIFALLTLVFVVAGCGSQDIGESGSGASNPNNADGEGVVKVEQALSAYTISSIANGPKYSQQDSRWASIKLGKSTQWTIGDSGCFLVTLTEAYNDVWGVPTTPPQLNTSAIAANPSCFDAGSAYLKPLCTINSRGGPHNIVTLANTSAMAASICAGKPVVVHVTWGGGHYVLAYAYNGGSTSATSSYTVVDPWTGTTKSLSNFSPDGWYQLL